MIPDLNLNLRMSVRALVVVAEIILMSNGRRTTKRRMYATELLYRAYRTWVLDKAIATARTSDASDAIALDNACKFWMWFRTTNWIKLYKKSEAPLDEWFKDLMRSRLTGGAGADADVADVIEA